MALNVYLNFDGNCRDAMSLYAQVFRLPVPKFMTVGEMPCDPNYTPPPEARNRVMHSELPLLGTRVMACDCPLNEKPIVGDNISLSVGSSDMAEVKRIFAALEVGGKVEMALRETFFSKCFGVLVDRFGIQWMLVHEDPAQKNG